MNITNLELTGFFDDITFALELEKIFIAQWFLGLSFKDPISIIEIINAPTFKKN
jgi:hypothetical protein